jgi:MFS family permease
MARRTVRLLAAARLVSVGGSQAAQVALVFTIFQRTHSATWVAAALVASAGVVGLVGPLSGWIGDRLDRRRVMVTTELAAAAGWAAMLLARGPLALVLVALVATVVSAPFRAASSAAIPNLVDAEDLGWANGVIATAFNASLVVGTLAGGALVAISGPRLVFAISAVSFVVSAALLSISRGTFSASPLSSDAPGPRAQGARAGFVVAWRDRVLRSLVLVTTCSFAAFGVTPVADVPLTASFHAGSVGYGLLTTLWGLGAVAGSLLAACTLTPVKSLGPVRWGRSPWRFRLV